MRCKPSARDLSLNTAMEKFTPLKQQIPIKSMHLAVQLKENHIGSPKNWQVQGFQMSLLTVQIDLLFKNFWQFLHMFHGKSPPTHWPLHPRCSRQHYMSPRWLPSPRTSIPAVHGFSVSRSWSSQKDFLELPRGKNDCYLWLWHTTLLVGGFNPSEKY